MTIRRPVRQLLLLVFLLTVFAVRLCGESNPIALYNDAMNEYALRRLKQARNNLEELIKTFPNDPLAVRAKLELARILIDQREFDKAIDLLLPLTEGNPRDGITRISRDMLVKQLLELQRFKQGVELLEKWWKENTGDETVGRTLASFYLQTGRPDEARLVLEGLLERTAGREVFEDLLKLATKTGTVDNLLSSIEQRRVRYRTMDYLDFVSDCQLTLKQEKKAGELLRTAPETWQSLSLLKKLGQIDLGQKDPARALEAFKAVERMTPFDWENLKAMGNCLMALGKKNEAIEAWRKPLKNQISPVAEGYQQLTDVFIENKLYQEALDAFAEARVAMGNPTSFAEERARVFEAMDKKNEALEEYLIALAFGFSYKPDIFDKLFKSQGPGFDLKARLIRLQQEKPSISVKRALLEVYFREEALESMNEILSLDPSGGVFDEILFERIQQGLSSGSSAFLHRLIITFIQRKRQSSLAFRLSKVILEVPDQDRKQAEEAFSEAEQTARIEPFPDLALKAKLMVALGRFCLTTFNDPGRARPWLELALEEPVSQVAPDEMYDALLVLMRLSAMQEDFAKAQEYLDKAKKITLEDEDLLARLTYEEAWLEAQQGNFQPALEKLKTITTDHLDSLWVNEALSLGLFLTMGSTGNLETLQKYMKAERAFGVGSCTTALSDMQEVVKLASDTPLAQDAEARVLLMSESLATGPEFLKKVDDWILKHPPHWLVPDLMMMKWRLLRRLPESSRETLIELLKDFIERFPGDLRARRVALALQELMREKGKK